MSKETLTFLFGIALLLVPFLGIPEAWKQYIITAIGAILVLVGYALRRDKFLRRIEREGGERATDSFVETTNSLFTEPDLPQPSEESTY
jgi:hypothetical protein